MPNKHELWELQSMQAAPLSVKISMTKQRIRDWVREYGEDGVYVSFSGGKDSTVLLTLVREEFPNVPAVFCAVPTQYPELEQFAKTFDNVEIVRPKLNFFQVCEKYGFPLISKEVSETVAGARKYLTRILEENSLDRPTDITDTDTRDYADRASIARNSRGGTTGSTERSEESENLQIRIRQAYRQRQIQEAVNKCRIGGVEDTSENLQESLRHLAQSIANSTVYGLNCRAAILLGLYEVNWGKNKTENIPDKAHDKSMFSCERYQFFLDAPFEISNMCCHYMKKQPMDKYAKRTGRKPMTAQMASESRLRTQVWLRQGCNAFDAKKPMSNPMAFWTEQDVLLYIYENHIPICSVYGEVVKDNEIDGQLDFEDLGLFDLGRPVLKTTGAERTGCVLCGFGCHLEKPGQGRFEHLKETHPGMYKLLDVAKNSGVTMREAIDWTNEHGDLHIRY